MGLTRVQKIKTSKGEVNIQIFGKGQRAFVLIHGNSSSSLSFSGMINEQVFLENYTSYCVDLPGHGNSGPLNKRDYNLELMADIVAEVITALSLQSFDLLGHSLGGHIALRATKIVNPQKLFLLQCSPGKDLGEVASYFQPLNQSQYLYVENPNISDVTSLFDALTNSKGPLDLLVQDFLKTDPKFRSSLGESLGNTLFSNEIDILKNLRKAGVQTFLVISSNDQFLKTEELGRHWSNSEMLNFFETKAVGHYAHFSDFSVWFQSFKNLMVKEV